MIIKNPEVTIIIPTFNRSNLIKASVTSALEQSISGIEIIVVDDGSIDGTEEILHDYIKKSAIKYLKQENKGPSAARNYGIKNSQGKYICFLDSDDTLQLNSIENRLSVYKKYPNIGLLCTDFKKIVLGSGNEVLLCNEFSRKNIIESEARNYIKLLEGDVYLFNREISYDPLLLRRLIWTGTVMIPRNVFYDIGYFKEELRIAEDIDLWFRIARNFEIGFLDLSTATYVIHEKGITKNIPTYYNSTIKVFYKFFDPVYKFPQNYKKKIKIKIAFWYFNIGYFYYKNKNYRDAGRYFRKASNNNKFSLEYYQYVCITLFPDAVIDIIRNFRRRLFMVLRRLLPR